jgi:hypothetical protein
LFGNNRNSGWACFAIASAPRFLEEDLKIPSWCPLPDLPSTTPGVAMSKFTGVGEFKRTGGELIRRIKFALDIETRSIDIDSFDFADTLLPGHYSLTFTLDFLQFHFPDIVVHDSYISWILNPTDPKLPPIAETTHTIEILTPIGWCIPFMAKTLGHDTPIA